MQYYTLYLEWSTFYKLCFLVDHSFPSVVFPFVNPTKYALFSFIIQFIVYICDIPHKSLCNYHYFIIKFYVNVYFVKYFIPLLLMEINSNWIELNWNKIAQQLLTNHKLPNSPTANLLGIFSVGQSIAQLLGKIWLNKVTSKIDQNGKNINCFHGFMA